ncbi:MAG TPA: TetR/AcrR family transcriptional regulator [Advenella kashmirensis]|uniref:TetR/AcrR family transcriptional regulator n=1 Tax=Advenella kashmirensis TaxID=310575 RepID=A0A356LFA5_9BURK|nr:TetR/AcrR family transcriptional regulator [Advenella sp. FME57]HBP29175.1 TetR/AcrR family transcriptional regulator [Advenella kashmirensis]
MGYTTGSQLGFNGCVATGSTTVNDISTKATLKGEALRSAILDVAATLFIERGTGGTSIQDIAEALGLSRTAVYYYFKNKEQIQQSLTEEVLSAARKLAGDTVARDDLDPVTALRALVTQHADLILSRPAEFRVADRTEADLSPKQRISVQNARRNVLENFSHVIERGIREGVFRMVDAHVAAFSLIGMCNWSAWWYKPEGRLDRANVAGIMADMAVNSLLRDAARRPEVPDVRESLRLVREDLDYLEKLVLSDSK